MGIPISRLSSEKLINGGTDLIEIRKVGDRVITPTGRTGAIVAPDADMPNHYLILFDDDRVFWMLKSIIKPCPVEEVPTKTKKRVKAKSCYDRGRQIHETLKQVP
jgi:hypothetical protein